MRRGWFGAFVLGAIGSFRESPEAVNEYSHLFFKSINLFLLHIEFLAQAGNFFLLMPHNRL